MAKNITRAIIFDDIRKSPRERKVLLVFEQPGRLAQVRRHMWRIPGGKCCNSPSSACGCPENAQDTTTREVIEETGLLTRVIRRIKVYINPQDGSETYYFLVRVIEGNLRQRLFGRNKIQTPHWFAVTELPENMNPHHRRAVEQALEHEQQFFESRGWAVKTRG